jgi:hypothetical protein
MNVTLHTKNNSYNKQYNDNYTVIFDHDDIRSICDEHNITFDNIITIEFNDTVIIQVNLHRIKLNNINVILNNCLGVFLLQGITNNILTINNHNTSEHIYHKSSLIAINKNTRIIGDYKDNDIILYQD